MVAGCIVTPQWETCSRFCDVMSAGFERLDRSGRHPACRRAGASSPAEKVSKQSIRRNEWLRIRAAGCPPSTAGRMPAATIFTDLANLFAARLHQRGAGAIAQFTVNRRVRGAKDCRGWQRNEFRIASFLADLPGGNSSRNSRLHRPLHPIQFFRSRFGSYIENITTTCRI